MKESIMPKKAELSLVTLVGFILIFASAGASGTSSCPSGMAHYWKLDESSGTVFSDSIGANNASCSEGIDCPGFSSGKVGAALVFDGTSAAINIPADTSFDWGSTDSFSIEFWMMTDPASTCAGNQAIVGRKNISAGMFWVGCASGGSAEFELYDKNGTGTGVSGARDLTDGNWHHVVAVRDAGASQIRIYVDGTLENSEPATFTTDFDFSTPLNIGWLNTDGGFHFAGTIDEVAIYDRALSDLEIRSHYFIVRGYCNMCDSPVRIMPAGDSITYGMYGDEPCDLSLSTCGDPDYPRSEAYITGYRQPLYLSLVNAGYSIDFVGSLQTGQSATPWFEPFHQGVLGITAGEVATGIHNWLTDYPADIVLLHIGTNGFTTDPTDVQNILTEIDLINPDDTVLLARIINSTPLNPQITEFNDNVQAMAEQKIAAGDKIIVVDQENALTYPDDIWGSPGLHPSQSGYNKMANAWLHALTDFLPVCSPQAPVITSTPVTKAFVGLPYSYNVRATGNPIPTFSLPVNPGGMLHINQYTGMIAWTPVDVGAYSVRVQADSLAAGSDQQDFTIEVYEPPLCPSDIIHYWKLDETSGPSYYDLYGTGNASCTDCPTATAGIIGGAQRFTPTNKVSVADAGTFNWGITDSFSIEFWMKTDPSSTCAGNQVMVGRKNSTTGLFWVGCADGGSAEFELYDKNGTGTGLSGTGDLTDGNWHHVVAVRDAGANQIRIYVDGTLENSGSTAFTAGFDFTTPLNIGWVNKDGGYHFAGTIDEAALYNRALSGDEVQMHYTNGTGGHDYCYGYYAVTPSAGANGSISPSTEQIVIYSGMTFTITPDFGYHIKSVTGCGGTLTGNSYTTGTLTADCSVTADFEINDMVKRVSGATSAYYSTLQTAYGYAIDADTLEGQEIKPLESALNFDRDIGISLIGGYDADFQSQTGYTTIGEMTISKGTVIVNGIVIQ